MPEPSEDELTSGRREPARRTGWSRAVTGLAALLVLSALLLPDDLRAIGPGAVARLPAEALAGITLLVVLPAAARRSVAVLIGTLLGLLTVLKILDTGYLTALGRPFDPVLDWVLFDDAVNFLASSVGRPAATLATVVAVLLAVAIVVLLALAVRRLARALSAHPRVTLRAVAVLALVWAVCAALDVRVAPAYPVADRGTTTLVHDRAVGAIGTVRDQREFATRLVLDEYRETPPDQLLTALRGKDVVLAFVESYGRDAVEDPEFAPAVTAVLDEGQRRLAAAGFAARSAFLTSPTAGGGSWLAHSTLLSGLWIDNQQRYRDLEASNRMTLTGAFHRAGWRAVAVMPGVTQAWPEAAFYGYDRLYDSQGLGYRGPNFSWATMPDQYTLSALQRLERATPGRGPLMAEVALVSSHAPWAPLPRPLPWDRVGDGAVYNTMAAPGDMPEAILTRDPARVRADYRRSLEYSLSTLISFVETYGDDNLVLVFLGDHQPSPIVTGPAASRDVPITIVTRDRSVLDRIADWRWQDGLRPSATAPVWRMDAFRDRFLAAFGASAEHGLTTPSR